MIVALLLSIAAADAPDPLAIPPTIRAMLDAAMASGDENAVNTIVKYARVADPASGDASLKLASEWKEVRARERNERLREATAFELWTGRIEAGGFASTGNTQVTGITGTANLQRESLNWRHKLRLQADYQRNAGVTSREHYLAAYEPNYKIDDRLYLYGSAQFEADRFFGYNQRYSASSGAGYNALRSSALTLDIELGPAFRYTDFTDGRLQSSPALRGSMDLNWKLSSGVTVKQNASAYAERFNSTVSSNTALAAKLIGPLSAQFSYMVQYESAPPEGRVSTDTTSRASLVYSF
ncbi:DUF481 domain-containing protein [Sphingomonas sp. Mn802worker]|uniref:DUF481 domain-containing protein n=1 Tax=Sphingomonas sp. Mn802worker TaxID=629773 RepID=UPI000563D979|nr:DUF481 domain-containing protein [Sphingomonas sp. Mn802worker]